MKLTVLLAHGSPDARWQQQIENLTAMARMGRSHIKIAYFESCEPSLGTVAEEFAAAGGEKIRVLPLFMAEGRHLRKDIPAIINDLAHSLQLHIELLPCIGKHEALASAVEQIVTELVN